MKRPLFGTIAIAIVLSVTVAVTAQPAAAATSVTKAQRELIIVSADMSQGNALERGLYDVIEWSGVGLATGTLALRYNAVRILKDDNATRSGLVSVLRTSASKSTIRTSTSSSSRMEQPARSVLECPREHGVGTGRDRPGLRRVSGRS